MTLVNTPNSGHSAQVRKSLASTMENIRYTVIRLSFFIGWGGGSCMVGFQKSGPTLDGSDKARDELISTNVAKHTKTAQHFTYYRFLVS